MVSETTIPYDMDRLKMLKNFVGYFCGATYKKQKKKIKHITAVTNNNKFIETNIK